MLRLIKMWLKVPVAEQDEDGKKRNDLTSSKTTGTKPSAGRSNFLREIPSAAVLYLQVVVRGPRSTLLRRSAAPYVFRLTEHQGWVSPTPNLLLVIALSLPAQHSLHRGSS